MQIRPYSPTDRELLLGLLQLNTPTYFAPSEAQDFADYLDNQANNYFVVELDEQIIGCGGFNTPDGPAIARLSWDIVHPQYQGNGIGSALTRYRLQEIRKIDGVKTVVVRTSQLVYPFYERFGFRVIDITRDFWAPGFDMYRMEAPMTDLI